MPQKDKWCGEREARVEFTFKGALARAYRFKQHMDYILLYDWAVGPWD